ncbi:hypothetical protein CapIbe_000515 [Capra ibex]
MSGGCLLLSFAATTPHHGRRDKPGAVSEDRQPSAPVASSSPPALRHSCPGEGCCRSLWTFPEREIPIH